MRKSKYLLIGVSIIILLLFITNTHKAVFSIIVSYIVPVDNNYIFEKGEWLGDRYGIISLHDKTDSLSNNIIYRDGKAIYKINRLNKHFNTFVAIRLQDNQTDIFTATEEFTK